jgi:serine phosphatase RsbU (regulator of sigma subunit)
MSDLDRDGVNHWLCPSSIFSGDLIAVQMALDGKLYVMLADSSGHGLAAALPTLAVAKTFHRMLNEGFSLQRTLQEINHETQQMLPTNRFLAAVAFAIDYEHQLIECWNGGFPPVFIVNRQNDIVHQFKSEHLALGIVGKDTFETHTDIYQWNEEVELLAYSDGLVEATDDQGQAFGERLLMQLINESTVADRVAVLKNAVFEHIQAEQSDDDISIISICCDKLK